MPSFFLSVFEACFVDSTTLIFKFIKICTNRFLCFNILPRVGLDIKSIGVPLDTISDFIVFLVISIPRYHLWTEDICMVCRLF